MLKNLALSPPLLRLPQLLLLPLLLLLLLLSRGAGAYEVEISSSLPALVFDGAHDLPFAANEFAIRNGLASGEWWHHQPPCSFLHRLTDCSLPPSLPPPQAKAASTTPSAWRRSS